MEAFGAVRVRKRTSEEIVVRGGGVGRGIAACAWSIGEEVIYGTYFCVWDKYPSTVSMRNI